MVRVSLDGTKRATPRCVFLRKVSDSNDDDDDDGREDRRKGWRKLAACIYSALEEGGGRHCAPTDKDRVVKGNYYVQKCLSVYSIN